MMHRRTFLQSIPAIFAALKAASIGTPSLVGPPLIPVEGVTVFNHQHDVLKRVLTMVFPDGVQYTCPGYITRVVPKLEGGVSSVDFGFQPSGNIAVGRDRSLAQRGTGVRAFLDDQEMTVFDIEAPTVECAVMDIGVDEGGYTQTIPGLRRMREVKLEVRYDTKTFDNLLRSLEEVSVEGPFISGEMSERNG
jgi:hypothetical protein